MRLIIEASASRLLNENYHVNKIGVGCFTTLILYFILFIHSTVFRMHRTVVSYFLVRAYYLSRSPIIHNPVIVLEVVVSCRLCFQQADWRRWSRWKLTLMTIEEQACYTRSCAKTLALRSARWCVFSLCEL